MSITCKTFDTYIKEMIYHPEREKKWLADKRLTVNEKKILQGYLYIRDNQNAKVIEELTKLAPTPIEFVHAHWELLLGISYNNIGNFTEAERYLKSALASFQAGHQNYHSFTALLNLVNLLSNTGRISELGEVVEQMIHLRPDSKLQQIRLLRCEFIYACDINDQQKARDLIRKISKIKDDMSESDLIQHLVCEFMFYVKNEELELAKAALEQMKKHRKFMLSENFVFMKKLLSHLMEDSTIYAYEREFTSLPILFHQIKVIECLQSHDSADAQKHWSELQKIAPEIHQDQMKYAGEKCLFSLCLDKHRNHKSETILPIPSSEGTKLQTALEIIQGLKAPIKKSHLYELIWGEEPQSKDDLVKLANIISKIRRFHHLDVVSRKGTYTLMTKQQKAS